MSLFWIFLIGWLCLGAGFIFGMIFAALIVREPDDDVSQQKSA